VARPLASDGSTCVRGVESSSWWQPEALARAWVSVGSDRAASGALGAGAALGLTSAEGSVPLSERVEGRGTRDAIIIARWLRFNGPFAPLERAVRFLNGPLERAVRFLVRSIGTGR